MKGLGKLIHDQTHDREANHGIRNSEIKDKIEPLGAALLDEAKESDGHQHIGSDDE